MGPSSPLVVWTCYWVDGKFTDAGRMAQIYLAKARLLHHSEESAVVAIATEDRPSMEPASVLQDFLHHLAFPPTRTSAAMSEDGGGPPNDARPQ